MLSVAVIVIGNVPVWVGVPLSTPAVEKVNPVGNVLAVLNVVVPIPPDWVKVWLNAVPAVPVVVAGLVTVIVWQLTVVVAVALSLPGAGSDVADDTVAVFVNMPVIPAFTTNVKTALPTARVVAEQETVPFAPTAGVVHDQPPGDESDT